MQKNAFFLLKNCPALRLRPQIPLHPAVKPSDPAPIVSGSQAPAKIHIEKSWLQLWLGLYGVSGNTFLVKRVFEQVYSRVDPTSYSVIATNRHIGGDSPPKSELGGGG